MEAPLLLPVSTAAGSSSSMISIIDDDSSVSQEAGGNESLSSPSTVSIVFRVAAVLLVACASLLAQHEASKGFAIAVATRTGHDDTAAGRRFHLFFVSNGRAERIVHRASRHVERALFPDASFPRKRVARVTVTVAGHNLTAGDDATVDAGAGGEYVISLSPDLLLTMTTSGSATANRAIAAAVRRAVARMWLWDGRGAAPARVTESMVEYLAADGDEPMRTTWQPAEMEDDNNSTCMSARFLRHLEQRRGGFVARLHRAMRDRWSDAAVDAALGAPALPVCAAYLAAAATTTTTLAAADSTSSDGSSVAM